MSLKRFEQLDRYIHLADSTMALPRGDQHYDPLYKVRPIIRLLGNKFSEYYKPDKHILIDETMIGFKERTFMKQCTPKKPTKWGLKVWSLVDCATYLLRFDVYNGKCAVPAQAEICKQHGLGYQIVTQLRGQYIGHGHYLYFDRYFSSLALAVYLLSHCIYLLLHNCSFDPQSFSRKFEKSETKKCRQSCGISKRWNGCFRQETNFIHFNWTRSRQDRSSTKWNFSCAQRIQCTYGRCRFVEPKLFIISCWSYQ